MKVQLGWLREHVDLPETAAEVAERLTAVGLTVDETLGEGDAAVFDVDVPANRCDALSHVGVARELAVAFERPLRVPAPVLAEDGEAAVSVASVTLDDPELCPRYAARIVRGVRACPSPAWMAERLEACDIRPLNALVDVTNYVLLELGHPLHAFDLARLAGPEIVVRRAREGEVFETLDGQEHQLTRETLLIADAERGVALAGVMGGENSEIGESTRDVLIESAWFDPVSIRRTSKRTKLHTESSHRFERCADRDVVPLALDRAAELMAELAGGSVLPGRVEAVVEAPERKRVRLRAATLERLGGVSVPGELVERVLGGLGFELVSSDAEGWSFDVPRRRSDVSGEVDLVEEVLRHWGYDRVPATLPAFREGASPRRPWELGLAAVRRSLVGAGYHQAVTYAFGAPEEMERWAGSVGPSAAERRLELANPMREQTSVMRTSIVPGLLQVASRAARREETEVRIFEEGCVYFAPEDDSSHSETLAEERRCLALVVTGHAGNPHFLHAPPPVDLLAVKGALLGALGAASGRARAVGLDVVAGPAPQGAPGSSAEVRFEGQRVGWLARIHPELLRPLEIEQPLYAAEVDLEPLLPQDEPEAVFTPISRFPKAVRDLSVLVDRNESYGDIIGAARELMGATRGAETTGGLGMESIELIDRYLGSGVPEGKVSLTFSVTYRRLDRTLAQEEVDELHGQLLELLERRFGAVLRG